MKTVSILSWYKLWNYLIETVSLQTLLRNRKVKKILTSTQALWNWWKHLNILRLSFWFILAMQMTQSSLELKFSVFLVSWKVLLKVLLHRGRLFSGCWYLSRSLTYIAIKMAPIVIAVATGNRMLKIFARGITKGSRKKYYIF